LTYSQSSLTLKDLETKFPYPSNGKMEFSEMLFAQEHHKDGNLHWHVYLNYKRRVTVSETSFFDCYCIGTNSYEHPHIKKVWNVDGLMVYMNKEKYKIYEYGMHLESKNFARKKHVKYSKYLKMYLDDKICLHQLIDKQPNLLLSSKKLIEGKNLYKISKNGDVIRYRNSVPIHKKRHFWIYGKTDSGKSYYIENIIKKQHPNDCFLIPYNNDFFGYNGERIFIADEFSGQIPIWQLNLICDGDSKVNIKGSSTVLYKFPVVYVLSNYSIKEAYEKVYEKNPEIVDTLYSRFRELYMDKWDIFDCSNGFSLEKRVLVYDHTRDYDKDRAEEIWNEKKDVSLLQNARDTYFYNQLKQKMCEDNMKVVEEVLGKSYVISSEKIENDDIDMLEIDEDDENGSQAIEDNEFDELDESDY
jgi:hypothetical protein